MVILATILFLSALPVSQSFRFVYEAFLLPGKSWRYAEMLRHGFQSTIENSPTPYTKVTKRF
jgi:hypothetical protein